jgi:hypothetical protein
MQGYFFRKNPMFLNRIRIQFVSESRSRKAKMTPTIKKRKRVAGYSLWKVWPSFLAWQSFGKMVRANRLDTENSMDQIRKL